MTQTRVGSSYKEEVLRFLHSKPNGTFSDDRIGVTGAVASALMESGLPVTSSTVSSAFYTLRNEGRITIKYGHRSLDNHLLIIGVTVLSEPHDGAAVGPSSPVERSNKLIMNDRRDDEVAVLLRKLIRLMEGQPSITDAEIERFQTHVKHLIDENQTWEALAQEAEDGFAAETNDLRQQLLGVEEKLNNAHQTELDRLNEEHEKELHKIESRSAELRERAERYRLKAESINNELHIAEQSVQDTQLEMERVVKDQQREIQNLKTQLTNNKEAVASQRDIEKTLRAEVGRLKQSLTLIGNVESKREIYLIRNMLFSVSEFRVYVLDLFDAVLQVDGVIRIDNKIGVEMGIRSISGERTNKRQITLRNVEKAIDLISKKNNLGMVNHRGKTWHSRDTSSQVSSFIQIIRDELDYSVGKVPSY